MLRAQLERYRRLELRVAELERRLGSESTTSGMPPSKDPIGARERRKAERKARQSSERERRKDRKRGRQPGHPGTGLSRAPDPDEREEVPPPTECSRCGTCLDPARRAGHGACEIQTTRRTGHNSSTISAIRSLRPNSATTGSAPSRFSSTRTTAISARARPRPRPVLDIPPIPHVNQQSGKPHSPHATQGRRRPASPSRHTHPTHVRRPGLDSGRAHWPSALCLIDREDVDSASGPAEGC